MPATMASMAAPDGAKSGLRAVHPAAAAAAGVSVKLPGYVRCDGGERRTAPAGGNWSPSTPPKAGSSIPALRAPVSGLPLLLQNENSSWLQAEASGRASTSTSGNSSTTGVGNRKKVSFKPRQSPPEVSGDPYCEFLSDKTSLVTRFDDSFGDYIPQQQEDCHVCRQRFRHRRCSSSSLSRQLPLPMYPLLRHVTALMMLGQRLEINQLAAAEVQKRRVFLGRGRGRSSPSPATRRSTATSAPVAPSYGSPPPVLSPLGQCSSHAGHNAGAGASNPFGGHNAPPWCRGLGLSTSTPVSNGKLSHVMLMSPP